MSDSVERVGSIRKAKRLLRMAHVRVEAHPKNRRALGWALREAREAADLIEKALAHD